MEGESDDGALACADGAIIVSDDANSPGRNSLREPLEVGSRPSIALSDDECLPALPKYKRFDLGPFVFNNYNNSFVCGVCG